MADRRVTLVRYSSGRRLRMRTFWRKLAFAVLAGMAVGIGAGTFESKADVTRSPAAAVSVERPSVEVVPNPVEIERLRTRNRRLEALVTVLRERTTRKPR